MGFFSTFFCKERKAKIEEITSRSYEDGFSDIFLRITDRNKTGKSRIYIAKGLFMGKTVGLQFEIMNDIPNGISFDGEVTKLGFVREAVKIKSIGPESDEFVKALGELYFSPTGKSFSKRIVVATAFSLNQRVADLNRSGDYKFKLFFESDNENAYCEIYFNINTHAGIIELREKDNDYREKLLDAFTDNILYN